MAPSGQTSIHPPGDLASRPPKPWWQRWWAIAIGVFILLAIIGNIANTGKEAGKKSRSSPSSAAIKSKQSAPPKAPRKTQAQVRDCNELGCIRPPEIAKHLKVLAPVRVGTPVPIGGVIGVEGTVLSRSYALGRTAESFPGRHIIGMNFKLFNPNQGNPYTIGSQVALVTASGERIGADAVAGDECKRVGRNFDAQTDLAPGEARKGCVPFEIKDGDAPKTFQFVGDQELAQWAVG